MKLARLPARKATTSATSRGAATRPIGCIRPQPATTSSSAAGLPSLKRRAEARSIGVSTEPGQTALTRTPVRASSRAMARTSASSAPLLAAYAGTSVCVPWAWTDETTTIDPRPLRRRWGKAARAARKTPLTLTAKTSSQVASSVSTTLP